MRKIVMIVFAIILLFIAIYCLQTYNQYVRTLNMIEEDLRNETRIFLSHSEEVYMAISKLTVDNISINELLNLQSQLSRMRGVVDKSYSGRLVSYDILTNIYQYMDDNISAAILKTYLNKDAMQDFANNVKPLKEQYLSLHQHLERVYGPFIERKISSNEITKETLENLNLIIGNSNASISKVLNSSGVLTY